MSILSRRLLFANLAATGLAAFLAVSLVRDLTHPMRVPPPPLRRHAGVAIAPPPKGSPAAPRDTLESYGVVAERSLFNPSRREETATAAPALPVSLAPRPLLDGVVVDGAKSRAYLEDPRTRQVLGYGVGDTVAGGQLEAITEDRAVIRRPDGPITILLYDPARPKPVPPAARSAAASRSGSPPPTALLPQILRPRRSPMGPAPGTQP
ncbi:MAG TPA: hypothetical protein VEL75_14790 [Candidatus Methylomirabilis sp.]|nr:hypothetical protein [Candidatus Methylomirabilis sp.]